MSSLFLSATDALEKVFSSLGMGSGLLAPLVRFFFGFVVGTVVIEATGRFSIGGKSIGEWLGVFDNKGTHRPWAITNPNAPGATFFPWFIPGILLGLLFGVFI